MYVIAVLWNGWSRNPLLPVWMPRLTKLAASGRQMAALSGLEDIIEWSTDLTNILYLNAMLCTLIMVPEAQRLRQHCLGSYHKDPTINHTALPPSKPLADVFTIGR